MNLPYMTAATGKNRKQIIAFAGLNYGQGAGDGELAESWGLSSARFPCLSQRDGRKTAGTYTSPTGLYARGKLCVVDGTDFLYDGKVVGHVTAGEKQCATINTKIVIFPDKVYYDTEAEKFGMLAAEYPGFPGDVTFTANTLTVPEQSYIDQAAENAETKGSVAADTSITAYTGASVNKTTGALTMSGGTAGTPDKLKAGDYIQYDCDSSKEYMVVQSSAKQSDGTYQITYLLHTAALHKYPGFDELFKAGDAIEISGCTTCAANNGSHIIRSLEARKLTFTKDIFTKTGVEAGTVMLERKVPDLTCICECDNRIWGAEGKTIYASGKGNTPEYALNYVLTQNGIDPDKDVTIEYYSEATEVTAQMANTEDAIAVLPQPYVTAAGLQDDTLRVALDLTEEWNKVADTQLITGVTVVRKEYAEEHPDVVAAFLTDYAKSVEAANADLDGTAALCEEQGVVAKAAIAKKALPNCNIVCLTGDELKTNASAYLQVLFDADPKAVGGAMPGDDFYWTAE